ncbi:DUF6449 domain-containing protein [Aquibacillus albus]|uniref:ABC-2 type transport system permease protein n=1 Tax=Aquibacillus albus TaxID=1168171 RepID=A0ABS2N4Z7_9BACI|nr:DUF6449 domain-containing protein [Aquibacillus albus]MBM7573207.1 ABC-2 type transport system permease protein [Aquibacillus albus]
MQLKTSSYKKELMKQDLRNVGWIGVIYFVALIFAVPLEIMMRVTNDNRSYYPDSETLFSFHLEIQVLAIFIVPVILSIFLFRYMQVKSATDFVHSLPLKRERMFHHHLITGVAMLIIPQLLIAVILLFMNAAIDLEDYFVPADLGYWLGVTTVVTLTIFLTGILVGMVTGISAVQGVLTYILLLFPAGIVLLLLVNLDYVLIGFSEDYYLSTRVTEFSPITDLIELFHRDFTFLKAIIYLCISVVFYYMSIQLYKNRKLEAATQALVFSKLKPVFKYGVTFCATLLGGFYFGETQHQFSWILVGYILGSMIGYLVAEMVLEKTWRVFGNWKGYLYYSVAAVIIYFIISIDITGYENRIPEAEAVDRIYLNESPHRYSYAKELYEMNYPNYLSEKKNIEAVRALHQQLIEHTSRIDYSGYRNERMTIAYELSNGKMIVREYSVKDQKVIENYLKPIYESKEHKETQTELLHVNSNDVSKVTISPDVAVSGEVVIVEPEQLMSLVEGLKADIYAESYDDIVYPRHHMSRIRILTAENRELHVQFKQSFENVEQWLRANNFNEDAVVTADDITKVAVQRLSENDNRHYYDRMVQISESSDDVLVVEEKDKIEAILNSTGGQKPGERYVIGYFFEGDDYPHIQHFASDDVIPDFVLEYFNK